MGRANRLTTIDSGLARRLRWLLITTALGAVALYFLAYLTDSFYVDGFLPLVFSAAAIAVCQAVVWPHIFRLSSILPAIVFPFVIFLATALIIAGVAKVDDLLETDSFRIDGLETAIWISIGMTAVITFLSAVFSLDDRPAYDRMVTEPLRHRYEGGESASEPGVLFLEIDGLARPVLEAAIERGYAPTMKRWLEEGTHRLCEWEPDLSSQTSASQAGILLGSNENIPAFRWWNKATNELMVSSSMKTAQTLEVALASEKGLLAPNGVSRFNVFSGGAIDCLGTFSKLAVSNGEAGYWAYFANPYSIGRLISRFFQDVIREWWEEFQQNRKDVQPRVSRPWTYAFVRAGTTAALLELTQFMAIADIMRGVPSAYYTIFAYDEVAHHTGIDREYTFRVIARIDAMFSYLEDVARTAKRPMHLVVLSDHGQSQGATFKQRYGHTLSDLVKSAMPAEAGVGSVLDSSETKAHFQAVLADSRDTHPRTSSTVARLLDNYQKDESGPDSDGSPDAVVLASGNLGLISFPAWNERMTLQQIFDAFPQLIQTLNGHDGIGFVLVNDEVEGGIVMSSKGVYYLNTNQVEGENPLAPYGTRAADHLRRTNGFPDAPDILVNSRFWEDAGEVAAFEELVGSHGGLGGTQQQPFLLYPTSFRNPEREIVGAEHLNRVLKGWIMDVQPDVLESPVAASGNDLN